MFLVFWRPKKMPIPFLKRLLANLYILILTRRKLMNINKIRLALTNKLFVTTKDNKSRPNQYFLLLTFIMAVIFIALSFTTSLAWLFIVLWVIWLLFVLLTHKGRLSLLLGLSLFAVGAVLVLLSIVLLIVTQSSDSDSKTPSGSSAKALTTEQCKPYYDKYNNTVLKISSDGLQGTIGINIDMTNGCKLHGFYNVLVSYALPQNPYKKDIGPSYHYIVMLRPQNQQERTKYDGYGTLSPAYKNFTTMPDPFSDASARSELYSNGSQATETSHFYWGYEMDTNFSEARYQEVLDSTNLQIVDGTPYIEEKQENPGWSYTVNDDRAAVDGTIVKTYTLTIE
jgi:hypothetical protein